MTYKLSDVVFETDRHWVLRTAKGYEVYRNGATASERCATIGYPGAEGLEKAKAEVARREARA